MRFPIVLAAVVFAAVAAPAHAARVWGSPEPIPDHPEAVGTQMQVDVAADGTTAIGTSVLTTHFIMGAGDRGTFTAAVGDRPPVAMITDATYATGRVAALPGGGAVAAFSSDPKQDGGDTQVRFASADGVFGSALPVGHGHVDALASNRAGDAVLVLDDLALGGYPGTERLYEAFAPAGGTFGAPVPLPPTGGSFIGLTLGEAGEATIINGSPDGPQAISRVRDGAVGAPAALPGVSGSPVRTTGPVIVADGQGRVLVAWSEDATLHTVARSADGTWGAPTTTTLPARIAVLRAATDPAGDAVIATREEGGAVRAVTASLAGGTVGAPVLLDDRFGVGLAVAENARGSAIVADGDLALVQLANADPLTVPLHVMRRTGTGAFGAPEIAGCPADLDGAWLTDGGDAILLGSKTLIRDAPGPGPAAPCSPRTPQLFASARHRRGPVLRGGLPVRVTDPGGMPLRLTWRARGHVLARRTLTAPATVRLRADRAGRRMLRHNARLRTTLVLRLDGRLVAVRRVTVRRPGTASRR